MKRHKQPFGNCSQPSKSSMGRIQISIGATHLRVALSGTGSWKTTYSIAKLRDVPLSLSMPAIGAIGQYAWCIPIRRSQMTIEMCLLVLLASMMENSAVNWTKRNVERARQRDLYDRKARTKTCARCLRPFTPYKIVERKGHLSIIRLSRRYYCESCQKIRSRNER